jgi:serine/threonine-protein kinase RsbW
VRPSGLRVHDVEAGTLRIQVDGDIPGLAEAQRAVRAFLEKQTTERALYYVELALDELLSNVIKYAYAGISLPPPIDVQVSLADSGIVLTIDDGGPPFNPLEAPPPQRPETLETASIGGMGIELVRRSSTDLHYERLPNGNRIAVTIARE